MKVTYDFCVMIALPAYMLGATIFAIGREYEGGVYNYWLPLEVMAVMGTLAYFSFMAGRKSNKQ